MAITPAPPVPGFPVPVPNYRTQDDAEFNESMQNLVDALNPFHAGMLTMAQWMQQTGTEVTNIAAGADLSAQDALGYANIARAIAAYKGPFSSLSGTLAIPASTSTTTAGVTTIWMLLQTTANIQNHVPGVSSVWYNLTIESGVQLVSSPTDMRADRAVNPGWLVSRGVGSSVDLRGVDLSSPAAISTTDLAGRGRGVSFGFHDAVVLGIPGVASSIYGKLTINSVWIASASGAPGLSLEFVGGGRVWIRQAVSATAWADWREVGAGAAGSSADGPIKTLVLNVSANNQDGSGNIPVTINCAEHSSFVVNAQNSPFPSAAGAYNITISNLPAAAEGLFIGRIRARNLGRKAVNFILPAGLTASWLSLPQFATANTTAATTWDWIEFFRSPDSPNVIYFDQVNGR